MSTDLYYSPQELFSFADPRDWLLIEDEILDDPGSLTAKMGARLKGKKRAANRPASKTAEQAALTYDAILKYGYPETSYKEWLISRLLRLAGLPAAPVQLLGVRHIPSLNVPAGALIHVIPSTNKPELWKFTTEELNRCGVDSVLVCKLKAFTVWASGESGAEIGEFRLSQDGIPFLIDHQDSILLRGSPINALGDCRSIPYAYWRPLFHGEDQVEIALEFWAGLPALASQLDQLDKYGAGLLEPYRQPVEFWLTSRMPGLAQGAIECKW